MKKFLPKLLPFAPYFGLLLLTVVVALTNYTPHTYLTGWDNLHPEFNFGLNITRSFQAVWQEYQGVGLLGGMAHASDLIHQLFLLLLSFFIPAEFLRYIYHFLMLFLGMSGMYFLLANIVLTKARYRNRVLAGLVGAVFYLFNLGTIQYFYVPFEPYSTFWGFFPWLIATLLLYYSSASKKHLVLFALVNLLATPMAYVQTIFLIYVISVASITIGLFYHKKSKVFAKKCISVALIIFATNAFWLLPNLYFVLTNLSVTQDAMQNKMATEKFFQMNKNRGTIDNLVFLKEFYFDFFDFNDAVGKFQYMMESWRLHYQNIFVYIAGIMLFLGSMAGFITTKKYRLAFIALLSVCLVVFLSNTFGFSLVNMLFRFVPVVNQILRNPFTKLIVPMVFCFALGLGMFISFAMDYLEKKKRPSLLAPILAILLIFTMTFPIFQGKLISPTMRVSIPKEYFALFDYFKHEDHSSRIMNLPQGGFWGWEYYKWGLRGSGFLWYGIEQPILDRAFDVWSKENEGYYWELSLALQKRDQKMFNDVLEKYQVGFILYDNSLLFADNINSLRFAINQEALLKNNPKIKEDARFGNDIRVYKVDLTNKPNKNILTSTTPPSSKVPNFIDNDKLFATIGSYVEDIKMPQILYPFSSLFTKRTIDERDFTIEDTGTATALSQAVAHGDYQLTLPSLTGNTSVLPVDVEAKDNGESIVVRMTLIQPTVQIGDTQIDPVAKSLEVSLPASSPQGRYILSLNNKDYFTLTGLNNEYTLVGSSYLVNANNANSVRLYRADSPLTQELPPVLFDQAKLCGKNLPGAKVSSKSGNDSTTLLAMNTANCTVYKTPLSLVDSSLVGVSFLYQSKDDEYPQYCIYSQNTKGCLNKKDLITQGFSHEKTRYFDYFEANRPNDTLYFHAILEAQSDEDIGKQKQITYSQIRLTSYPYIGGSSFTVAALQTVPSIQNVTVAKNATITLRFKNLTNADIYNDPISSHRYKSSALNYDTNLKGAFTLTQFNDPERVQASAMNASSYLLLRANNLSTQTGYLLKTVTRNIEGFPFTINTFTNQEFRSHVYTYASSSKSQTTSYFVLPPLYPYDNGLSFLLGSNSYNSSPSTNELYSLTATPFPYEFATGISLEKTGQTIVPAAKTENTVTKHSLFSYSVKPAKDTTFITLSQGFNEGWAAYQIANPNILQQKFPFLFAPALKHVKVNSWENGWNISSNTNVEIIYLPQWLEALGFGTLLGFVIWLILWLRQPQKGSQT